MVVMVVVMIRRRLGIHYADRRRSAAKRIVVVGSATTASRHVAVTTDSAFCWRGTRTGVSLKTRRFLRYWRENSCTDRSAGKEKKKIENENERASVPAYGVCRTDENKYYDIKRARETIAFRNK